MRVTNQKKHLVPLQAIFKVMLGILMLPIFTGTIFSQQIPDAELAHDYETRWDYEIEGKVPIKYFHLSLNYENPFLSFQDKRLPPNSIIPGDPIKETENFRTVVRTQVRWVERKTKRGLPDDIEFNKRLEEMLSYKSFVYTDQRELRVFNFIKDVYHLSSWAQTSAHFARLFL